MTTNRYYNQTPDASDTTTVSPNAYYQASAPQWVGALQSSEVGDSSHTLARTELYYDDAGTTGNLTEQRSWDSTKGALLAQQSADASRLDATNSISVFNEYDPQTKNRTAVVDARGTRTSYVYGGVAGPSGTVTDLYPTETRVADGTTVQRKSLQEYDFYTGLVTKATDADNNVYATTTYDVFGRPILVKSGLRDGQVLPEETHTATVYSDVDRRVIVRSDLNSKDDGKLVTVQHYDQLGRARLTRKLEDSSTQGETDETAGIKVQTRYAYGNPSTDPHSYTLTSNPYRAATSSAASGETTMGWTVSTSDQAGRVVRVETFNGAGLPAPFAASAPNTSTSGAVVTSYDAEKTTVTDQAGHARQSVADGLGRLSQVVEAPGVQGYGFQTAYAYNALGNLMQVSQGVQTRTFNYSSLSRLTSAINPEGGAVGYEYDDNGNLKKKTDPRLLPDLQTHLITTYDYDELNRVKTRTYNDNASGGGTPNVTYSYDTAVNGKGRLSSVSSSVSTYSYASYDALGRVTASSQIIGGVTYLMPDYRYNLAGELTSEQYPSGRVVKTDYDAAGRMAGVRNQATNFYYAGGDPTLANNPNVITYAANGAALKTRLGNGLWEHTNYNSRLQATQIGLGTSGTDSSTLQLDYTYGTDDSHNNNNVRTQTITVAGMGAIVQSYTYDALNRLSTAQEAGQQGWTQNFTYDRYGNRNFAAGTTYPDYTHGTTTDPTGNPVISTTNNRIDVTAPGQSGYRYDEAGNLLCDLVHTCGNPTSAPETTDPNSTYSITPYYTYDAENKMVSAGGAPANGGATYTYDGDGHRVTKVSGAVTTVFVYDSAGRMVAEYGGAQPQTTGTSYITQDHIGSTRVITGQDPNNVRGRYDYLPFGEEIPADGSWRTTARGYGGNDNIRQKFTGKERDAETGLDFFGARYYLSTQGRFTSPDPLLGSGQLPEPQSWNRFAYVRNNPLRLIDPSGLDSTDTQEQKNNQTQQQQAKPQRVIYIFVTFDRDERTYSAEKSKKVIYPSPDFAALQRSAPKGTLVKVFMTGSKDAPTPEQFKAALEDPNAAAVIYIGHTAGHGAGTDKDPWHATSLDFNGVSFHDLTQVKAQFVGLFGCDTKALAQNYDEGAGQKLVGVDSGADGFTRTAALTQAGFAAARSVVAGNPDEAVTQANAALQKVTARHTWKDSRGQEYVMPRDSMNKGDSIVPLH